MTDEIESAAETAEETAEEIPEAIRKEIARVEAKIDAAIEHDHGSHEHEYAASGHEHAATQTPVGNASQSVQTTARAPRPEPVRIPRRTHRVFWRPFMRHE